MAHQFSVKMSAATEALLAERLTNLVMEPAWQNRNRSEARMVATATARKLAAEVAYVLRSARQVAPATVEV